MFLSRSRLSDVNPGKGSPQIVTLRQNMKKKSFLLQFPADYQADKTYPLVIALHGWTEKEDYYFRPFEEEQNDRQEYPCIYLAPNNTTYGWGEKAAWARKIAAELTVQYPIDEERIYIIGFSMGGSGSFDFAESLYKEQGLMAAAILRCAGMSRPTLKEPLFFRTALSYNIGDRDSLENVFETFQESMTYYSKNTNTSIGNEEITFSYKERQIIKTTKSLTDNDSGLEKYRFSLYSPMSHEYGPVFLTDEEYGWLFSQSLGK